MIRNKIAQNKMAEIATNIKLVLLDLDGILTNGLIFIGEENSESRTLDIKDCLGIRLMLAAGLEVAVISISQSKSMEKKLSQLGIRHMFMQVSDKNQVYEELLNRLSLTTDQTAFLANDLYDLHVLSKVAFPACVADASPAICKKSIWISHNKGGGGAVREFAEFLLEQQGLLNDVISKVTGFENKTLS